MLFACCSHPCFFTGRTSRLMGRMSRILLDTPNTLPGIPRSVLSVPMENKYKCQQCLQVLRKPVQAQCGHRFCVHCFKQLTRYTGGPRTTYNRVKCKPSSTSNPYPFTGHTSAHPVFLPLLASWSYSSSFDAPEVIYFTQTQPSHDWTLTLMSVNDKDRAHWFHWFQRCPLCFSLSPSSLIITSVRNSSLNEFYLQCWP